MTRSSMFSAALLAAFCAAAALACGESPTAPTGVTSHPLASESAHFRFFHTSGSGVEIDRQEAYHVWVVQRLGVSVPQKIDYHRYASREEMGRYTGRYNTNGYAEPEKFTIHIIFPYDNHETVHVYSALIGRPSDFFNEGIAVALQTDPLAGVYEPVERTEPVHDSVRRYRASGALVLPLAQIVTTSGFRAIPDTVLSYREAGSFVAFLADRFGMECIRTFFGTSTSGDSLTVIRARFQRAFGTSLEEAEAAWLAFLG